MDQATFGVKSATGRALWNFLCNRGNEILLEFLFDHFEEAYGREALDRDAVPGVRIPRSMPRGAFFQKVIMPWVDENVDSFIAL